jgi:hypothetical protein
MIVCSQCLLFNNDYFIRICCVHSRVSTPIPLSEPTYIHLWYAMPYSFMRRHDLEDMPTYCEAVLGYRTAHLTWSELGRVLVFGLILIVSALGTIVPLVLWALFSWASRGTASVVLHMLTSGRRYRRVLRDGIVSSEPA